MMFFYCMEYSTVQENYCIINTFYTKIIYIKQSEHKHAQVYIYFNNLFNPIM